MDTNLKYYHHKLYIALYIHNDRVASSIEAQLPIVLQVLCPCEPTSHST
jgi:hypothetical protein